MAKIVIAGCRDFTDYEKASAFITQCLEFLEESPVILCGGCRGADRLGERYAMEHRLPIEYYPADWKQFGNLAGPMRNETMARICDYVICFWDGRSRGTADMIRRGREHGKQVFIMSTLEENSDA